MGVMVFVMGFGPHCRHLQLVGLVNTMHGGGDYLLACVEDFCGATWCKLALYSRKSEFGEFDSSSSSSSLSSCLENNICVIALQCAMLQRCWSTEALLAKGFSVYRYTS